MSTGEWLQRVASVQRERATPEQIAAVRARSDAQRTMAIHAKRAARMSRSMQLSSTAWSAGVQSADATPHRASATMSAMSALSSPAFLSPSRPVGLRHRSVEEMEAEEAAIDEQLNATAQQQVIDGTIDVSDVAALTAAADDDPARRARQAQQAKMLDEALAQLETEPTDEAACAAKFVLYEGFAKLTENAREALFELWAGAQADLDAAGAPATKAQIAREIARVDRPDHLGIADEPHRWFVHGMCRAACKNQRMLDAVLSGITTKLELLASQSECPVCLEAFGEARPPTTLGCAHKCCEECWASWSAVAGHRAVCPLCRHEEFLSVVLNAADRA